MKIRLGTNYGGWSIPSNILNNNSICYLAGVGEDISFDIELVELFNCNCYLFDPTPRAIKHYNDLIENTKQGKLFSINNSAEKYTLKKENIQKLHYKDVGIWNCEDTLKFYEPKNELHVSHSILNLQKTQKYFSANVTSIEKLMEFYNHSKIDLLKLDIEGAEYVVIDSLIKSNIKPQILLIEFDELNNAINGNYLVLISESIQKLIDFGYKSYCVDGSNYTFVYDFIN